MGCGRTSRGCLLAPPAYLMCAYVAILCTFADRWSTKSIPFDCQGSGPISESRKMAHDNLDSQSHSSVWFLQESEMATGVQLSNSTRLFLSFNYSCRSSERRSESSTGVCYVQYWFGLFHVCRHDLGKCFVYTFEQTKHLKGVLMCGTYLLFVLAVCPIVIHKLRLRQRYSNLVQLPCLLSISCSVIYVMSEYKKFALNREHTLSWTYHLSTMLVIVPWVVWYWHTLHTAHFNHSQVPNELRLELSTLEGTSTSADYELMEFVQLPRYHEVISNPDNFPPPAPPPAYCGASACSAPRCGGSSDLSLDSGHCRCLNNEADMADSARSSANLGGASTRQSAEACGGSASTLSEPPRYEQAVRELRNSQTAC